MRLRLAHVFIALNDVKFVRFFNVNVGHFLGKCETFFQLKFGGIFEQVLVLFDFEKVHIGFKGICRSQLGLRQDRRNLISILDLILLHTVGKRRLETLSHN